MRHRIRISCTVLALSAATAGAQTIDSAPPTAGAAAAALPKWFDELSVNAFVSTAFQYNGNRPTTGATSYRVFDFNDN